MRNWFHAHPHLIPNIIVGVLVFIVLVMFLHMVITMLWRTRRSREFIQHHWATLGAKKDELVKRWQIFRYGGELCTCEDCKPKGNKLAIAEGLRMTAYRREVRNIWEDFQEGIITEEDLYRDLSYARRHLYVQPLQDVREV